MIGLKEASFVLFIPADLRIQLISFENCVPWINFKILLSDSATSLIDNAPRFESLRENRKQYAITRTDFA